MVFSDILSETAQFYLYQVHVQTAWLSVRAVFTKILFGFERKSRIFWNTGHHPDVLPRRLDGLQRLPKFCRLLKSNSLLNTDRPSVRTVLLWRPDAFKGPSGKLHKNRLFLSWILQGFFIYIFKKLVISYCLWFDHFLNTWRFRIENRPSC